MTTVAETDNNGPVRRLKDWTEGSIIGNLVGLSWPMIINQMAMILGPTADMIWVGKLGSAALAGVGVSAMIVMFMNSARMGLQTGTRALIARFIGAGDTEGANNVVQQAMVVSVAFSVLMAAIGIFLAEPILKAMGMSPAVISEGTTYLRIQLVGTIAMSTMVMAQGIMQSAGDAIIPMRIAIGSRLFHVIVSPMLIFGIWIFPRMEVSGAALTGVISQGLGAAVGIWVLYTGRTRIEFTMKNFHFDGHIIWRMVKIGIPATLNGSSRTLSQIVVTVFVAPFGTVAVAAHSLMQRIDQFVQMPGMAVGQASGIIGGQSLGAGKVERADKTGWAALWGFTIFIAFLCIGIWFGAPDIIKLFDSSPDMVRVGGTFLRIEIVQYLVFGFVAVLMNFLNGVGDTMLPALNTVFSLWVIQIPLAWALPRVTDLGVLGVRWAMVIAVLVRAAIYGFYFKTGRWKTKRI